MQLFGIDFKHAVEFSSFGCVLRFGLWPPLGATRKTLVGGVRSVKSAPCLLPRRRRTPGTRWPQSGGHTSPGVFASDLGPYGRPARVARAVRVAVRACRTLRAGTGGVKSSMPQRLVHGTAGDRPLVWLCRAVRGASPVTPIPHTNPPVTGRSRPLPPSCDPASERRSVRPGAATARASGRRRSP